MFTDSSIAKKYSCARTKTSAIVDKMARMQQNNLIANIQKSAFSIAIDGSNDSDAKLYPIIVTYYNDLMQKVVMSLLCLPNLTTDGTGENIANLILNELNKLQIPTSNMIAFGSDNAAVMVGHKKGVVSFLKKEQKELIMIGCPCHLINLAAEKAATALPIKADKTLIDIFYYLERSSKRKENLKAFQELHGEEVKKILKHVATRWLSLSRALDRLIEQWDPLLKFFHAEIKSKDSKYNSNHPNEEPCSKKLKFSEEVLPVEERVFYFLSSELNKVYCSFLLSTLSDFDKSNILLQSASPKIHILKKSLEELLKSLYIKFVKPSIIKKFSDLTEVPFDKLENQKDDNDLVIGHRAFKLLNNISVEEKEEFFLVVRKYFENTCKYIIKKFPLKDDVLLHAEVADLKTLDESSFASIKYFINKFPFLLTIKDGEESELAWDLLQKQFNELQCEDIEISEESSMDAIVGLISNIRSIDGTLKYDRITKVLKAILIIPHSNAECERMFSTVKKNKTQFRSAMSVKTLENILIIKSHQINKCFETDFSNAFLSDAKKATVHNLSQ